MCLQSLGDPSNVLGQNFQIHQGAGNGLIVGAWLIRALLQAIDDSGGNLRLGIAISQCSRIVTWSNFD